MPFDIKNPKTPSKEEIVNKVKASGCDAVFVSSVLKKEEGVRYTPGTTAYTVMPDYTYTGNYYGYYSHWQPTVSTPAYYSQDKTYFMQSNLYEVASEEIMWSVQSKVFSPLYRPEKFQQVLYEKSYLAITEGKIIENKYDPLGEAVLHKAGPAINETCFF